VTAAITLSSVVLPLPEWPTTATNSPPPTGRSIPARAVKSPAGSGWVFTTPWTTITWPRVPAPFPPAPPRETVVGAVRQRLPPGHPVAGQRGGGAGAHRPRRRPGQPGPRGGTRPAHRGGGRRSWRRRPAVRRRTGPSPPRRPSPTTSWPRRSGTGTESRIRSTTSGARRWRGCRRPPGRRHLRRGRSRRRRPRDLRWIRTFDRSSGPYLSGRQSGEESPRRDQARDNGGTCAHDRFEVRQRPGLVHRDNGAARPGTPWPPRRRARVGRTLSEMGALSTIQSVAVRTGCSDESDRARPAHGNDRVDRDGRCR
jgi:hypothetical protein